VVKFLVSGIDSNKNLSSYIPNYSGYPLLHPEDFTTVRIIPPKY
jgi:hypothetical protein